MVTSLISATGVAAVPRSESLPSSTRLAPPSLSFSMASSSVHRRPSSLTLTATSPAPAPAPLLHRLRSATASSIASTAAMAGSTPDHRFSFLPPFPISFAAALDLPRLPSSSTQPPCLPSLPVISTSTAHPLPLLSSSRSRRRCSRRPPASSPVLAVTPAPHSPPPSPSSSVSVLIGSLDGSAMASLRLCCRSPPPPVFSPSPPSWP